MKFGKLMRNRLAPAIFFSVLLLAAAGAAYLAFGIGANVNCAAGVCRSTNGQSSSTTFDDTTVFTGENDTASIECTGGTYKGGGGNDTFYLHDPQTATKQPAEYWGEDGDDVILDSCTPDNDILYGGNGNDFITDGEGKTRLYGDNGNDLLAGGQDNDTLAGGDGNDVLIGGPGPDTYTTAANDGDDIVIIHRGDVIVIGTTDIEKYTCYNNDTILLFGFDRDLVFELTSATPAQNWGFDPSVTPPCFSNGYACLADPVNTPTGADKPRYEFNAATGSTCTIIFVD